ncbi:MAG: sensor domain-containing diguanylate cyclase [bacterium]
MYNIIIPTICILTGFFTMLQFPETAVAVYPVCIAVLLSLFLFARVETAVLIGIVMNFIILGVLSRLPLEEKLYIAGGIVSMVVSMIIACFFELRKKQLDAHYMQEIKSVKNEIKVEALERNRLEQSMSSLHIRGILQDQLRSIVRDLAGTFDASVIRQQMFTLLKEMVPHGSKQLVSSSALYDPADEWVARQRVPILSQDISTDGRFLAKKFSKNIKSLMVAPLVIQGRVEEILRIESEDKKAFTLTDLRIVELITLMTSVSLGNARLYAQAESQAMTDGLTGLFTQNYFIEKLQQELLFARRYKAHIAVMMIDVDHFKHINDTFGHLVGDAVLKHISSIIQTCAGPVGSPARYGGEEFSLLLPQTGMAAAKEIGMQLLKTIEQTSFAHEEYTGIRLTVSIGISVFPEDGTQGNQLLSSADSKLYRAKANGRNQVIA